MIVGPNTGLGHNSMVFMIESQVEYILRALKTMKQERAAAIEVRPQAERTYNEQIQQKLGKAIWSTGGLQELVSRSEDRQEHDAVAGLRMAFPAGDEHLQHGRLLRVFASGPSGFSAQTQPVAPVRSGASAEAT
jgi:hypothetical protein